MANGENINTYMGNAGLAQGTPGGQGGYGVPELPAVNNAVDKLTYYNFLEKRDRWAQANLDADKDAQTAAAMGAFKLEDWTIPQDRQDVLDAINGYNQYFAAHPGAAKLRYDSKGNVTNSDEYVALQRMRNDTLNMINRAHTRTAKQTTMESAMEADTDPDTRAAQQAWLANEMKKPIGQDLVLYPNIVPFNANEQKAPALSETNQHVNPTDKDLLTKSILDHPDLQAGVSQADVIMQQKPTGQMADFYNGGLVDMQQQIAAIRNANPGVQLSDQQIIDAMAKTQNGATWASMYNYFNYRNNQLATELQANPELNSKPYTPITLDNLSRNDIVAMVLAHNGTWGTTITQDELHVPEERTAVATTASTTRRGQDLDLEKAKLQFPQETGEYSAQADAFTTIAGRAFTGTAPVNAKSYYNLQNLPGMSSDTNNFYAINTNNQVMQNVLKSGTSQFETLPSYTQDGATVATLKGKDMNIVSAFTVTDKASGEDPEKNKYVVVYQDPGDANAKPRRMIFTNDEMLQLSGHANDNLGIGGEVVNKANLGYQKYLKARNITDQTNIYTQLLKASEKLPKIDATQFPAPPADPKDYKEKVTYNVNGTARQWNPKTKKFFEVEY